jgi:uncharacterized membrane protein YdbT with pleckstrin-like domain
MSGNTNGPGWVTLTPEEQVVWSGHPSLRAAVGPLAGSLLLMIFGFGLMFGISGTVGSLGGGISLLQVLSVGLIGIGLWSSAVLFLSHKSVQYVVTTEKVYKKTGLLSRTVRTLWIDRIQHTTSTQTARERLLTYGSIEIETAGGADGGFSLANIPSPDRTSALLTEQLSEQRIKQRTEQYTESIEQSAERRGAVGPSSHDQRSRTRDDAQPRIY